MGTQLGSKSKYILYTYMDPLGRTSYSCGGLGFSVEGLGLG